MTQDEELCENGVRAFANTTKKKLCCADDAANSLGSLDRLLVPACDVCRDRLFGLGNWNGVFRRSAHARTR